MDKYDVFISYSRKDYVDANFNVIPGNVVSKVKEALTEAGISYWFDEEGIYSGQNFVEKIVTNIEASKIFLFLSTANSNDSRWTCKEIASADEYGKHIIPVRIDQTPYNKKVLFRIADLDYIEYYSNPEKGMKDMIESIKTYLAQLEAEEKRKKEEEERQEAEERRKAEEAKKKKEEEEKRRREEQLKFIANLKLSCTTLNNEESKLEIDRANLLLSAEKIIDTEQRDALKQFIINSSPIFSKYRKEYQSLMDQITKLKKSLSINEGSQSDLNKKVAEKEALIGKLQEEQKQTKQQIERFKAENDRLSKKVSELEKSNGFMSSLSKNRIELAVLAVSLVLLVLSFFPSICGTVFNLCFIIAPLVLIALIIGIVRPSYLSMSNRKGVMKYYLTALCIVLIATMLTAYNDSRYMDYSYDYYKDITVVEPAYEEEAEVAADSSAEVADAAAE